MGYSITAFTLPGGEFQRLLGSKDQAAFDRILASKAKALKENDEFFADMEDEDDDGSDVGEVPGCLGFLLKAVFKVKPRPKYEGPQSSGPFMTSEQLLHALIFGETLDSRCGGKLGYVIEKVCEVLGTREDANGFESMRSGSNWTTDFDKILAKGGVKASEFALDGLLFARFAPIPAPYPDDFPVYGYITAQELKAVQAAMNDPKLEAVAKAHEYGEFAVDSLNTVKKWVNKGADEGRDLFAFYY